MRVSPSRHPAPSAYAGWRVVGILFVGGLLTLLALHLLEPPLPVTWGYAHLSRRPTLLWLALLLTVLLPPLGWQTWRRLEGVPLRPMPWRRVALALAVAVAVLVPLSRVADMPALTIDPAVFRIWL